MTTTDAFDEIRSNLTPSRIALTRKCSICDLAEKLFLIRFQTGTIEEELTSIAITRCYEIAEKFYDIGADMGMCIKVDTE